MLHEQGVDVKTAQETLRHANPVVTMKLYQQVVAKETREAQDLVLKQFLGLPSVSTLGNPRGSQKEEIAAVNS